MDPVWGLLTALATQHPYTYTLNNPTRYTDASGEFLDAIADIAFIAYDVYEIKQKGWNWQTRLALVAGVGGALLPFFTGGGEIVRAASRADNVADAAGVLRALDRLDDSRGLLRFVDAATDADRFEDAVAATRVADWLDPAVVSGYPRFKGIRRLAEDDWAVYQAWGTGHYYDLVYELASGRMVAPDDVLDYVVDFKWCGADAAYWAGSGFHPDHEFLAPIMDRQLVKQMEAQVALARGLGKKGVRWGISYEEGLARFESVVRQSFGELYESGFIKLFHVPFGGG